MPTDDGTLARPALSALPRTTCGRPLSSSDSPTPGEPPVSTPGEPLASLDGA